MTKPKTSYHHGNLRQALIETSLKIITEAGVEGLSLRKATRKLGVSHAAVYRHFDSKHDLLAAVAEEGFNILLEELGEAVKGADFGGALKALGGRYVEFAVAHPPYFRVMFGPYVQSKETFEDLRDAADKVFQHFHKASGASNDESGKTDAFMAWAHFHGIAWLFVDGQAAEVLEAHSVTADIDALTDLAVSRA